LDSLHPTARVARGATFLFVQGFIGAIVSLVYFVTLAHSVPQEDMGVYTLLSFILALIQTFGTFIIPSAAVKYIAQHLAENDPRKAKAVVARVLQTGFLASAVAFLLLFIPAELVSSLIFGTDAYALLLRLIALYSILAILSIEVNSFLQGMQRMREAAAISLAYTSISAVTSIYLLLLGWRLYAVVVGWLVGQLIASIGGLILTAKLVGIFGKPYPVKPLLNFSIPLYLSSGIGFFVSWIDQLFLVSYMGLLFGATEAQRQLGIYHVAIQASIVPGLFSSSVVTALFPQLTALYTQQGLNSFKDAFRVSVRYAVLIGFPMIVGVATLAYPIVIMFAGFQYLESAMPLMIISLGALVGTLGIAIGPIFLTLERTRTVSVLSIISLGISLFLSYFALAVLGLGMIGIAWARTFASIIGLVLNLYVLTRLVPISFDKEAIWKASVASILMVIAIVGLDHVRMFLSPSSYQFLAFRLHLLPVYIIVGALVYFASLAGFRAIKKQDLELIYEYLPKNMKWVARWLGRIPIFE